MYNIWCDQSKAQKSLRNLYDQNTERTSFSSFFPGWVLLCKNEIFNAKSSNSYSWYPSLTCIHYASFGISVCRFLERIYSLTRVDFKLHDHCEVLARIWKAQNSPRLLPRIYSVLRLKYAEPSKFTVSKSDCEGAKKLQH